MTDLYPRARFVPALAANVGGVLESSRVRLFVVHVAQGSNQSGIDAWFRNPRAQVSAHFSIAQNGDVHQRVGIHRMAWHCENYNDVAIGIEHLGYSGKKLTRRALRSSLLLIDWLHGEFPHVPKHRTANAQGFGVIGHGELGIAGGDHPDCPGTPILYQFNVALRPQLVPPRR